MSSKEKPTNTKTQKVKERFLSANPRRFDFEETALNGNTVFILAAIDTCKKAAARCAEQGLTFEYQVFTERLGELQTLLDGSSKH